MFLFLALAAIFVGGSIGIHLAQAQQAKDIEKAEFKQDQIDLLVGTEDDPTTEEDESSPGQYREEAAQATEQTTEQYQNALDALNAQEQDARLGTYNQQRGMELQASQMHEEILVESEMALGTKEAKLGTSGVRKQGSAENIIEEAEETGSRATDQLEKNVEESMVGFDWQRGMIESGAERDRTTLGLQKEHNIESIDMQLEHALESGGLQQDWMSKQLDYLNSNEAKWAYGLQGASQGIGAGLNLAKGIASFF